MTNYIFVYFMFFTRNFLYFLVMDDFLSRVFVKIRFHYSSRNAFTSELFYFIFDLLKELHFPKLEQQYRISMNSIFFFFFLDELTRNWSWKLLDLTFTRPLNVETSMKGSQAILNCGENADNCNNCNVTFHQDRVLTRRHSSCMEINGGHQKGRWAFVKTNERFLRRGSRFHPYITSARALAQALVSRLTAVKAGSRTRFRFHPRLKLYANRGATLNYPSRYRLIDLSPRSNRSFKRTIVQYRQARKKRIFIWKWKCS